MMSMNALTNATAFSKPHPLVSAATAVLPHVRIRMNAQFPARTLACQTGAPSLMCWHWIRYYEAPSVVLPFTAKRIRIGSSNYDAT